MEKLKSMVPDALKEVVGASSADDILSTSSSLLRFFLALPDFHLVLPLSPLSI